MCNALVIRDGTSEQKGKENISSQNTTGGMESIFQKHILSLRIFDIQYQLHGGYSV